MDNVLSYRLHRPQRIDVERTRTFLAGKEKESTFIQRTNRVYCVSQR